MREKQYLILVLGLITAVTQTDARRLRQAGIESGSVDQQQWFQVPSVQVGQGADEQQLNAFQLNRPAPDDNDAQQWAQELQQVSGDSQRFQNAIERGLTADQGFARLTAAFSNILGGDEQTANQFVSALSEWFNMQGQVQNLQAYQPGSSEYVAHALAHIYALATVDQMARGDATNAGRALYWAASGNLGPMVAMITTDAFQEFLVRFGCGPPVSNALATAGQFVERTMAAAPQQEPGFFQALAPGMESSSASDSTMMFVRWMQQHREMIGCFVAAYPDGEQLIQQQGFNASSQQQDTSGQLTDLLQQGGAGQGLATQQGTSP